MIDALGHNTCDMVGSLWLFVLVGKRRNISPLLQVQ